MMFRERASTALDKAGQLRFLLLALSFLLFLDIISISMFDKGVLLFDYQELKERFKLQELATVFVGYSVILTVIVPLAFSACMFLTLPLLSLKFFQDMFQEWWICEDDFERYAIMRNNTVAYRELELLRDKRQKDVKLAQLDLFVFFLVLVELSTYGSRSDTAISILKTTVSGLHYSISALVWVGVLLIFVWIIGSFFAAWVGNPAYLYVSNYRFNQEIKDFIKSDDEAREVKNGKDSEPSA